ncbi:MAG: hypothetical protein QOG73_4746, partial [Acetobacteraceae bacterium]|nr:hypothetical protein [Acetobacteraceae bacterium]
MLVAGSVIAAQPIRAVSLIVKDEAIAVCTYGNGTAKQQAFKLGLAQRTDLQEDLTSFEVEVRTRDRQEQRIAFTISTGGDDFRAPRVVDGPVSDGSMPPGAIVPILLYVETAAIDHEGVLLVEGWSAALSQILDIQVLVGEQRIASAQLGGLRDDIAAIYPAYPNARSSGFRLSKPLLGSITAESVTVEVIDRNGLMSRAIVPVDIRAGSSPETARGEPPTSPAIPDRRRAIYMHCDGATLSTAGEFQVSGWVVCAAGVATVAVSLDGRAIGEAELGLSRPDVAGMYATIPQARYSGFTLKQQIGTTAIGDHQLDIRAHNGLDDIENIGLTVTASVKAVAVVQPPATAAPTVQEQFHFSLDHPMVIAGTVPHPVTGRLVIEGWALATSGIKDIDIFLDGRPFGQAYYGTARRDVELAFPNSINALRSGFIFHCPPRALDSGAHTIRLHLKSISGATFDSEFRIDVQRSQSTEDYATIRCHISRAETDLYQDMLGRLKSRPNFQIILVARGPIAAEKIDTTLRALRNQAYSEWHLQIVTDVDEPAALLTIAERLGLLEQVTVISADAALRVPIIPSTSSPCLFGVLSPGDELGCDALAEIAIARGLHTEAQFYYADEDRVSPSSRAREPFFKPAWSPDLLLSTNYIGRPWFAAADLIAKAKITAKSLLEQQGDYDAVLRCTELSTHIHHLPKLLCRRDDGDAAEQDGERRVLEATAVRRGIKADVLAGCIPGTWRLKRTAPVKGKVSIIIPTCAAKGYVATCLETLRAKTAYRNFEIICIDNIPPDQKKWKKLIRKGADKVVDIPEAFNWSRFNNRAAEQATGEFLLFLNDDIEIQREDWLDALLEHAQRPEVGIVGPQLLYPDRKVQHAGIFLTTLGAGRHSFRFLSEDDPGYFGLALTQRNVIAVTGACMLMRREVFDSIGRFDELHEVVNNDVDCCLRVWRAGLAVVYTPHAQLIHHELASRANIKDIFDAGHFAEQWRSLYATGDPFFSPRLTKFADEYTPDTEPARMICASHPLFATNEIENILAMKLDHIGDLITALPALRRLRQHFPAARIHLLASAAARAFLAGENCVDELIEFEFFHARSGLGQKVVTEEDLLALGQRLAPYRFDLAIDLRKQIETRHVLRHVPARFRAGYNQLDRFPWLDIALEWEGDNQLHRKHSHISTDLLRLVDVVAAEGCSGRDAASPAMIGDGKLPGSLPAEARALFRKPVVAVHPGVGAIMRQWPPPYFATVIDLLVEKNQVNVVLIGGPDEADLATEVLGHIVNRRSVESLVGRTSLADLTGVLRACALYLG